MSERTDESAQAAEVCEHYWAWVHPAGAKGSARICMLCHMPDAAWLNHLIEVRLTACPDAPTCLACEFAEMDDPRSSSTPPE